METSEGLHAADFVPFTSRTPFGYKRRTREKSASYHHSAKRRIAGDHIIDMHRLGEITVIYDRMA